MTKPRIIKRQINRPNVDPNLPEDYYRINIYLPLLDNIISDLKDRFNNDAMKLFDLNSIIPSSIIITKNNEDLNDWIKSILVYLKKKFMKFESDNESFKSEIDFWTLKWKKKIEIKEDKTIILQILCTFPVSVATAERSFSGLKRLKTWLRSKIAQERLTGLALLHIHRDIDVNIDYIIQKFGGKSRNLDFII